jgi:hypothetical protein
MAWVLSNVGAFGRSLGFPSEMTYGICASLFFRHCWSPSFCKRFVPFSPTHFARAQSILSTTNGSAKTSGANKTVNGYLIFILYSVFILARASPPFPLSKIADT